MLLSTLATDDPQFLWAGHLLPFFIGMGAYVGTDAAGPHWPRARTLMMLGACALVIGTALCGIDLLHCIVMAFVGALCAHFLVELGERYPA